jgi:hypothetical protein
MESRAAPSRLTIAPGDTVHLECVDASGAQVRPGMTVAQYVQIDRGKIHALTGPLAVRVAQPGDVLQIDVLEVQHQGWGWSSVIGGLGFLKQRFAEPYLFNSGACRRAEPVARSRGGRFAAILRRDGSSPGRGWVISYAAAGKFRRKHGCARICG